MTTTALPPTTATAPAAPLTIGGRPLRVAHIGNIAQNAYGNAKLQRALAGLHADSYDLGGGFPENLPWWEDALFDEGALDAEHFAWCAVAEESGFARPPWAKILGVDAGGARPWYDTQEAFEADLPNYRRAVHPDRPVHGAHAVALADALRRSRLTPDEQVRLAPDALASSAAGSLPSWRAVAAIARRYDLTVLYGPYARYGALLPADVRYVAFEHSTLRHVHRLLDPDARLLAAAYRHADAVVITNADCREAADCLGLGPRAVFVPHPLDDAKFCPAAPDDAAAAENRATLRRACGVGPADALFYAPARHSMSNASGTKANERVLYAFKRYVEEAEPRGAPRAVLVLASWGPHVAATQRLLAELGLGGDRVKWTPLLPKLKVREFYRAADAVLDQFSESVGSFGTVTAEALASGAPVVTYVDPAAHAWCLTELPPVYHALRVGDIYAALHNLARDPNLRAAYGRKGRAWVERHHGGAEVVRRHLALYARVLGLPTPATDAPPTASAAGSAATQIMQTDAGAIGVGAAREPVGAEA